MITRHEIKLNWEFERYRSKLLESNSFLDLCTTRKKKRVFHHNVFILIRSNFHKRRLVFHFPRGGGEQSLDWPQNVDRAKTQRSYVAKILRFVTHYRSCGDWWNARFANYRAACGHCLVPSMIHICRASCNVFPV